MGKLVFVWLLIAWSHFALACDLEAASPHCDLAALDRQLRMNDIQVIGTHNSYKQAMPPEELAAHRARDPKGADGIDYGHPPIPQQLNRGARTIELDVYYDPAGGRYAHPPGALRKGYPTPPWTPEAAAQMLSPGFKVMHLADIDFRSNCQTFVACLTLIRDWSRAHPRHVPIMLLLNAKDGGGGPGAVAPLRFDEKAFDALDAEVLSVFQRSELVTPDNVQGRHPTLRNAVLAGQWPSLGQARGKVFFVLDEDARKVAAYRGHRSSLEGRVMFVNTDERSPAAAYLTLNDPVGEGQRIARDVAAGFMVRTRADADTVEARRNDTHRREAAFASGAQYVSTDYMQADRRFSDYRVQLPQNTVARCNPVRAAHCPSPESGATP
ncbi:Phosphoinositide phospholipase C, Ca2+-dependent [Dyella sp. OK004]|uniref:phosphatidylinositol-specific phospholipase C1-like protein n=1 Tax=Dyella sp. OK004 TaxID=1855292 RepID=UPI0008DFDBB5|nr:phosphatidylinositol-specific phospholipase C1-like protein [Dyella sp. OK004]SFS16437.1 Phosphoinositide phospholipase C, Ca2+-dependent [Dyella sp. OK004]